MMTTTIGEIENVIEKLKQDGLSIPVIAGGASLNEKLAIKFGCYGYGKDAIAGLDICRRFIRERSAQF
jgi:5-methyltetrahydrofolate--homocysteine methyltransferase